MTSDPIDILNWRRIDDRLTTSGQPSAEQFKHIHALGVTAIINLAHSDNANAMPDEAGIIDGMDMDYVYIPVDFAAPTEADFDQFCAAMDKFRDQLVHIHCIYNARVSAFMTRYTRDVLRQDVSEMRAVMDSIWRPGGVWVEFLSDQQNSAEPNRYKGYEYD